MERVRQPRSTRIKNARISTRPAFESLVGKRSAVATYGNRKCSDIESTNVDRGRFSKVRYSTVRKSKSSEIISTAIECSVMDVTGF